MLPSENFASDAVRSVLSCDLSNRYTAPDHFYMGTKYTDQIQTETENLAKDLFKANFAGGETTLRTFGRHDRTYSLC